MGQPDIIGLGLLLAALGLLFWLATRFLMRSAAKMRPLDTASIPLQHTRSVDGHQDAVLVVQPGGRLLTVNEKARIIFDLAPNEIPNLERLARLARPPETFLNLCAAEGEARLVLGGKLTEAISYLLPLTPDPQMVVVLRYPELSNALTGGDAELPAQTLETFTELTQEMAASLDLESTIEAIVVNVEKLIPADFLEVTLWDAENDLLVPYRYSQNLSGEQRLQKSSDRYRIGQGLSGYLAAQKVPLLIPDVAKAEDLQPAINNAVFSLRSYVGVPLEAGKEFIGTLELGSLTANSFQQQDLNLLRLLSRQAAIALHNAVLYQAEQHRAAELSGLAQLAQAFGSTRDPKNMYSRLVQSITPLLKVQVLGFLLYNEPQRILEGQAPFYGIPPQFMEMYKAPVAVGSMLETTLLDQDVVITENAMEDPQWEKLGLDQLAKPASLRDTVLIPLSSGGRMLGYLQASNHSDGSNIFSQDELRLLMIVANQAAPIIENTTLVQQARLRAQRAEALRRIAALSGSAATLDEILRYALQDLARLLQADVISAFLYSPERGMLELHMPSLIRSKADFDDRLGSLPSNDPQFPFTVTGTQRVLLPAQISKDEPVIPFYKEIIKRWNANSIIIVPMVVRNQGIGELWVTSEKFNAFDQGDVQAMATAAGQLASVVEQSALSVQTDESLRQKVEQLTALTRISRELSTSLDLNYLLQLVYDEVLRTTRADCGTILLFDLNRASDMPRKTRVYVGDAPLSDLSLLELEVLKTGQPANIIEIASRPDFPVSHDGIKSAMVIPIYFRQREAGLMLLHAKSPGRFDPSAVEIAQSLASQAAVALGNALQYEEQIQRGSLLERELKTVANLVQVSQSVRPDQPLDQSLAAIVSAIQEATPFQVVVISLYHSEDQMLERVYNAGLSEETWQELRSHRQKWSAIAQLLRPEFKSGNAFFIPAVRDEDVPEGVHTVVVLPTGEAVGAEAWDADDFLLVPLFDAKGDPLGMISLDAPTDGRRPDQPTFEALDLFALQAGLIIDTHQKLASLEGQLSEMKSEQQRLLLSSEDTNSQLPRLLKKTSEQSLAIQSLETRVNRVRTGLELAELTSRQSDSMGVLRTAVRELLTRFDLQTGLIAGRQGTEVKLMEVIGQVPAGANPEALFGQRNPLRQVLQDQLLVLVANLEIEPEWNESPLLTVLGARNFVALPMPIDSNRTMGVLAVGQKPLPPFSDEDRQIYSQLARQVAVALQNIELLTETRTRLREMDLLLEFTNKLGALEPVSVLRILVESAIQALPSANAGWVALWDENTQKLNLQAAAGYSDNNAMLAVHYILQTAPTGKSKPNTLLPLKVYQAGSPRRVREVHFAQDYGLPAEDLMNFRKATGGRLPVSSMLIPLRRGEINLGVMVLDNFVAADAFTEEDEALAVSLSQQTALVLENARLFSAAEQRLNRLQALTQVAGTITSSLQTRDLINSLLNQLRSVLPYETATLWLRRDNILSIAAANGFSDSESRVGLTVAVSDSQLFADMSRTGQAVSVIDVRQDVRFPSLIEPENLSWLGIPLLSKSELVGMIALEKKESGYYQPEHIQAATTFASQAAVALENARLYEESQSRATELDERSQRLALLNQLSSDLSSSLEIQVILKVTAQHFLNALGGTRVAGVLSLQPPFITLEVEVPGDSEATPMDWPDVPLLDRLRESQGIFTSSNVMIESELAPLRELYFAPRNTVSILVVPLTAASNTLGWLILQTDQPRRFSVSEIDLARTIGNQTSIAVQNARLYNETLSLTSELEHRVEERTVEVRREHQNTQTLLRIITELSASLDMNLVLSRTLAVLNESTGAHQSMILLAQTPSIYHAGEPLVPIKRQGNKMTVSETEQDIARWVSRRKVPALVEDIFNDSRWKLPEGTLPAYHSLMAVPLILGEEALGSLLLFHKDQSAFIIEQVGLVEATARQISISLNNAELFNLIRDQAERLGGMLRDQQIESSRSRAILEAVADGVLVTDANNKVNLFNASGERILDLKSEKVIGQPLDQFTGLFGKEGKDWSRTIRQWAENPALYRPDETYSEQLDLENGKIVSIHLAPVIWRNDFLGTVSTFRDITHEVQVDRLKSEFVANVSHELRTPLTSIKGYAEVMLMGASGALSDQTRHFLSIIKENSERLGILVNDLLDISRIETGRVELQFQAVNMQDIAAIVEQEFLARSKEENKSINILMDIAPDLPSVLGDPERVKQILSNLVRNGYNYTPENGQVTVKMRQAEKTIQVDVTDNGIGISEAEQNRIFERFYRGNDPLVLATAGTGLGLALSKTLVDMHHGEIWFTSSGVSGEGSTFSFTLPIFRGED